MYVRMLNRIPIAHSAGYRPGEIHQLNSLQARDWMRRGHCAPTLAPAAIQSEFAKRLEHADPSKPALFLPFLGEFGHQMMYHVRFVQFHRAKHKIVYCREHEKSLYPSAAQHITDWKDPIDDAHRIGMGPNREWPELIAAHPEAIVYSANAITPDQQEECALLPSHPIPFAPEKRGLSCEVAIGTRDRQFAPEKNWSHWQTVGDALKAAGITFGVVGTRPTAQDVTGQVFHTGDLDDDASIEALQACKLYVGTDSGTSHLAATVGAPMLIFRYDSVNHWRDYTFRMEAVNPGRVDVLAGGWKNPAAVIDRIISTLRPTPAEASTAASIKKPENAENSKEKPAAITA